MGDEERKRKERREIEERKMSYLLQPHHITVHIYTLGDNGMGISMCKGILYVFDRIWNYVPCSAYWNC